MIDLTASTTLDLQLLPYVRKLLTLESEIAGLNAKKAATYLEAKHQGLDRKALKAVLALARKNGAEELALVNAYAQALGLAEGIALSTIDESSMGNDQWSPLDLDLDLDGIDLKL